MFPKDTLIICPLKLFLITLLRCNTVFSWHVLSNNFLIFKP